MIANEVQRRGLEMDAAHRQPVSGGHSRKRREANHITTPALSYRSLDKRHLGLFPVHPVRRQWELRQVMSGWRLPKRNLIITRTNVVSCH